MNKYKVLVSRKYEREIEVIAENEVEAGIKANDIFDDLELRGMELYVDYTDSVELIEENISEDEEDK